MEKIRMPSGRVFFRVPKESYLKALKATSIEISKRRPDMSEVITFNGITKLDMPPDRLLQDAIGRLESVVIVGFDKDGNEFFKASKADAGDALWHLQRAAHKLLSMPD